MRGWCISPGLRCDWNHEGGRGTDLGHHTAHTTPERSGENAGSEAINHPRWVTRKYPKKTTKDTIIQSRKRIIAPSFGKSFTPGPLGTVTAQSQHSDRRWFVSFFFFFSKITNTSWVRRNRSGTDLAWQEKVVLLLCKYVNFYSKRWLSSWNWPG